jgi:magnesium-transporting ATPase (P-type)
MKEMESIQTKESVDLIDLETIESQLTLLGATGVEDTLQENVKECIEEFRDAGM